MQVKKDAKEWYYSISFLLGANRRQHIRLTEDLEHQFLYVSEKYPKKLVDAYTLINNRKTYQCPGLGDNNVIQFTNAKEDEYE